MDLKLRVLEGKNAGQEIAVKGQKFIIGRAEDCHLRPGSDLISRHHCVLLVEDGYIGVRDFGSKNGTFVNQQRVVSEQELKAGDRLSVGPLHFEILVSVGMAKKRPPVGDIKEALVRTAHDAAQTQGTMDDVDQWLAGDDDPANQTVPLSAEAKMRETEAINLATTQTITPETAPETAAEPEAPRGPHAKKPPGKLPPMMNSTKDSKDAAAVALSKFRKRR